MVPDIEGDCSHIPPYVLDDIKEKLGLREYDKGHDYYRHQMVESLKIDKKRLVATCRGSGQDHYQEIIEFGGKTTFLSSSWCSCPVGGKGGCKHIAAVLIMVRMLLVADDGSNPVNISSVSPKKSPNKSNDMQRDKFSNFGFSSSKKWSGEVKNHSTMEKAEEDREEEKKSGEEKASGEEKRSGEKEEKRTSRKKDKNSEEKTPERALIHWLRFCLMRSSMRATESKKREECSERETRELKERLQIQTERMMEMEQELNIVRGGLTGIKTKLDNCWRMSVDCLKESPTKKRRVEEEASLSLPASNPSFSFNSQDEAAVLEAEKRMRMNVLEQAYKSQVGPDSVTKHQKRVAIKRGLLRSESQSQENNTQGSQEKLTKDEWMDINQLLEELNDKSQKEEKPQEEEKARGEEKIQGQEKGEEQQKEEERSEDDTETQELPPFIVELLKKGGEREEKKEESQPLSERSDSVPKEKLSELIAKYISPQKPKKEEYSMESLFFKK
ncbi:hypothetical protein PROFUN_03157 [Planoprotostelium fungivorum]|uniref:SWIM-type domain-containing protein n=1 Tax=Planoprotostelium fungivorum TaxID=1890364 RepID=A0A2P6NWV5_9EUKA|nr:hypothetical protein PROFUN_03157 [Planoprotostelium fungivorum]